MLAFRTFRWSRRRERSSVAIAPTAEKALAAIDAAVEALRNTPGHAAATNALSEARAYFADADELPQRAQSMDPGVSAYLRNLVARSARVDRDRRTASLTKAEEARETNIRC